MPPQKPQPKRVNKPAPAPPDFDAARWRGPGGALISGDFQPTAVQQPAVTEPAIPGGDVPPQPEPDAALDSEAAEPVA